MSIAVTLKGHYCHQQTVGLHFNIFIINQHSASMGVAPHRSIYSLPTNKRNTHWDQQWFYKTDNIVIAILSALERLCFVAPLQLRVLVGCFFIKNSPRRLALRLTKYLAGTTYYLPPERDRNKKNLRFSVSYNFLDVKWDLLSLLSFTKKK
jgi:hypothetical protein